ncbi:cytoskeleton-associated protein 4 [Erinaceus europaeus]|uniref:Cytoskeleton-associated protein 4 n=1 Tax=Erinaceus europaeus TaxID=9365 RepID=A0ABM3XNC9_ERIEU|nr:cytoskeleton-associated protein 4 [Erinaceus europaeus]
MPSAKQRGSKGGHGAGPADKGAHPPGGDDAAKKPPPAQPQPSPQPQPPQPPQGPAHGRGGHRAAKSSGPAAAAASSASCSRRLGRALGSLFYLALVAAAAVSGWCVHHVLQEVQQVRRGHQDLSRHREELGQGLQGVEQKVQSLQATLGAFESVLRSSQHKQDATDKAVKRGEGEIGRISEVLQRLQNEILKDLSDGIHVVKDARDRDFTSLENTVEERLTELTKSINDNIALFTEVQKRSQKEIDDVKAKLASLEDTEGHQKELKALREAVREVQSSVKSREKDLEALRSSLQTMESDVYTEVKELVSLKQEQQKFREAADEERLSLQALRETVLRAEEATAGLPEELRRLEEDLAQLRAQSLRLEGDGEGVMVQDSQALEALERKSQGLDARLQHVEDGVHTVRAASAQQTESLEILLSRSEEQERRLAALQERLQGLGSPDASQADLASTVRSLGEAQLSLYGDVEELKRSVGELPSTVDALQKVQEQVHTLLRGQDQVPLVPPDLLDRLSSLDNLKASFSQMESDLKMFRSAVDNLVAYSVRIEMNKDNLESVRSSLDKLQKELEWLAVKVEKIYEKV